MDVNLKHLFKILFAFFLISSYTNAIERLPCEISYKNVQIDITNEYDISVLCNDRYTSYHSNLDRIPYLVTEKINHTNLNNKESRTNDFRPDDRLRKSQRAELSDYYKSGYDRGHLAPSANYDSETLISETFLLSNIVPQNPKLNRTIWKNIENYARVKANLNKEAFIITGVLFNHCLIEERLNSRISVPDKLFKVIISDRVDVFIADNVDPVFPKIHQYRSSLDELNSKLCSIKITVR